MMGGKIVKVIIVSDQAGLTALQPIIRGWGYQTVVTRNGIETINLLQGITDSVCLIIDWLLPDMPSMALCRTIKQDYNNAYIVLGQEPSEIEEMEGYADDFLCQPIRNKDLRNKLVLGKRIAEYQHTINELNKRIMAKERDLSQFGPMDQLTCIPNQVCFADRFTEEWRRAARSGQMLSLVVVAIDRIDEYGLSEGNECLVKIARTLTSVTNRSGDFVARYRGGEFVALLPNTDSLGALVIAEAIRVAVSTESGEQIASTNRMVTVSVGTATVVPERAKKASELITRAHQALLLAKSSGRNVVRQSF